MPVSRKDAAMADLPADVENRCQRLAQARRWPPETEAAFLRMVAWFRALDEGPGVRSYYERADEEGLAEQGTRWLWETHALAIETAQASRTSLSFT